MPDPGFSFTLDPILHGDLAAVAGQLGITKEEAVRRALELYKHAVKAQSVELVLQGGQKQAVTVK